jgi:hypothetical protein
LGFFGKEGLERLAVVVQGAVFDDMVAVTEADGGLVNAGLYRSLRFVDFGEHRSKLVFSYRQPLPGFSLSIQDFCYQFILGSYKLKNKKKS